MIIGIILFNFLYTDFSALLFITSISCFLIHVKTDLSKKIIQRIFSILLFSTWLLMGHQIAKYYHVSLPKNFAITDSTYTGKIIQTTTNSYADKYIVQLTNRIDSFSATPFKLKIILNIPLSDKKLNINDNIIFRTKLKPINKNKNPLSFDSRLYWKRKGILLIGYEDLSEVSVLSAHSYTWIQRIQNYVQKLIDQNFQNDSAKGIAKALLLGDKSTLDTDAKTTFTNAGAMHVLAVSGLHVGLVALLFNLPFLLICRLCGRKIPYIRLMVILPVWTFAAVCNFSPSVTRASIMISFFIIAEASNRQYSALNILSLTALILLLYNPNYIYDIGFQLSFLAVLGLLLTYKPIRKSFHPKNLLVRYIWNLTCVTISVQLFLIPILFYYFHQFPLYFIPNSIIAVSSLSLILSMGFCMIIFSFQPFILKIFASLFENSILCLNKTLALANKLPANNLENIWIDKIEFGMLILCSIGTAIYLQHKSSSRIWLVAIPFLLFCIHHTYIIVKRQNTNYISGYSMAYHTAGELFIDNNAYSISTSDNISPYINGNLHSKHKIKQIKKIDLRDSFSDQNIEADNGIIFTQNQIIVILQKSNLKDIEKLPSMNINYLFIHDTNDVEINKILNHHTIDKVVVNCNSKQTTRSYFKQLEIINSCESGWTLPIL